MKINVTKEHIAKGKPKQCSLCPVALAIKDAVPKATYIMAGTGIIDISVGTLFQSFDSPESVYEFITNFDRGIKPHLPFSFDLDIPTYFL